MTPLGSVAWIHGAPPTVPSTVDPGDGSEWRHDAPSPSRAVIGRSPRCQQSRWVVTGTGSDAGRNRPRNGADAGSSTESATSWPPRRPQAGPVPARPERGVGRSCRPGRHAVSRGAVGGRSRTRWGRRSASEGAHRWSNRPESRRPPRPPPRRAAHRGDAPPVRRPLPAGGHGAARPQPDAHDDGHLQPRPAGAGPGGSRPHGHGAARR